MNHNSELAELLVQQSDELRGSKVGGIELLQGDVSARRYLRVSLENNPISSAIMVLLPGTDGPVGGGNRGLTQDDTYVEISHILEARGIRVPRMYTDARDRKALLIEDVGSTSLLDFAGEQQGSQNRNLVTILYKEALSIQKKLHEIPEDAAGIIYERFVTREKRIVQAREFLDHFLLPKGLCLKGRELIEAFLAEVCERVEGHPHAVSHFDYMSANIHVLPDNSLCLIDFQDMCIDSPARDIVSLLNDRGIDVALGRERQAELLAFYMRNVSTFDSFPAMYLEYLLHWDLRVTGRFTYLSEVRGLTRYNRWIAGTLRRLGRTLVTIRDEMPSAAGFLELLSEEVPEIAEGAREPWPVCAA